MIRRDYLIVGAGVGGASVCEGIREHDKKGTVMLVGAESFPPYHRPLLLKSQLAKNPQPIEKIAALSLEWFHKHHIDLRLDTLVTQINLERHLAVLEAEPELGFSFANLVRTEDGKVLPGTQFDLVPRLRELPTRPSRGGKAQVIQMDPFAALGPCPDLPGWMQASLYRRAVMEGCMSKQGIRPAEDLYLILQIYARGMPTAFIDEVLVEVRRHGKNSYTNSDQIREAVLRTLHLVDTDIALSPEQRAILHRRIGDEYLRRGWRHFWSHDADRARQYYRDALAWPGTKLSAWTHLAMLPLLPVLPRREPAF